MKNTKTALTLAAPTAATLAQIGCGGGGGDDTTAVTTGPATAPTLALTPQAVKTFCFTWDDVSGETEYRLLENPDGSAGYTEVATLPAWRPVPITRPATPSASAKIRQMIQYTVPARCTCIEAASVQAWFHVAC